MKRLIVVALLAGVVSVANAQDLRESEVPSVVLNAFQTKYSDATDVDWERDGNLYKVEFEISNKDHDLWIDSNGNITKHKEEVTSKDIPAAINQKLKSEFNGYRVDDVDRIETDNKVYYRIELDGKGGDREVTFLEDGTVQQ